MHGYSQFRTDDDGAYMDIKWRATDVELMQNRSSIVKEGMQLLVVKLVIKASLFLIRVFFP